MSLPYKNTVCRGSIWLGSGCRKCERCEEELKSMSYSKDAEKSDTHQVASEPVSLAASNLGTVQAAPSPIAGHVQGLPVAGYAKNVEQWKVDMVNQNKILEEKVLRRVDEHVRERGDNSIDGASVQIARRHVEDAFYRLNRAIMQPKRIEGDLA